MNPDAQPPARSPQADDQKQVPIAVEGVRLTYGERLIQQDLNFTVRPAEVFVIMGGSGCGKSTLLRTIAGLKEPAGGRILIRGDDFTGATPGERERIRRRMGVCFQQGALWSGYTLAENVALPLELHTDLDPAAIDEVVRFKLSLVGLSGFEDYYPAEISGGMRKRAAIARAMALDPEILLFDEPSAGLDPLSSRRLDDLILNLRDSLGATVLLVTHELASIFAVADRAVFLDAETHTMTAVGKPAELRDSAEDPATRKFLRRGEE